MLSLIVLLPLFASIIVGISYKYNLVKFSQIVTIICVAISLIFTIKLFFSDQFTHQEYLFDWLKIGNLDVKWEFFADKLILMMMLIITIISLSVHIYSIGYMDHDETIPRFMGYLSLFTFFMLVLVTSANLLQLFFGWEGVGLCSYLLIGYWYKKNSANKAAMKAFLVNRVADVAFITSLVMIYNIFETLDFALIFERLADKNLGKYIIFNSEFEKIDLICVLLLIGAMGKSAQLGLHVWLPDAMEGPTPISALIHAATMVTAGIFLIVRFSPIFQYSPLSCDLMLIIGSLTCLFGAIVAIGQNDVKKVIAYSTCSQLGYMFMACGAKAYNIAMFHLITHAFFKALLFLGAGSIIYATHHQQDIRKMGNLWIKLPITCVFMIIGTIAITGIYPFSGHYSKDAIIEILYLSNQKYTNFAYISSMITVFLTSIYSMRIICKIFHGPSYFSEKEQEEIEEPPTSMSFPLYILAIASVSAGYILKEKFFIIKASFWRGSLIMNHVTNIRLETIPENIAILPLIVTILGFALTIIDHIKKYKLTKYIDNILPMIFLIVRNKFYFDQIYKVIFVDSHKILSKFSAEFFDSTIINKILVNNFGKYFPFLSRRISIIQSGYIYHYVTIMILFTIMILTYVIFLKVIK